MNEIELCPICRRAYSDKNKKVKYHLQYESVPKFIYACKSCNYAEYLSRHWKRYLTPWQWYKIRLVRKFAREYKHLIR
jgi:hydrogenase maturation factor HypF (carbamoyltransferase family)